MKEDFQREKNKGTEGIIQDGDMDVRYMQLDLSSLKSTKKFIDDFKATGMKLHTLVCNAGLVFHVQGTSSMGTKYILCLLFLVSIRYICINKSWNAIHC